MEKWEDTDEEKKEGQKNNWRDWRVQIFPSIHYGWKFPFYGIGASCSSRQTLNPSIEYVCSSGFLFPGQ